MNASTARLGDFSALCVELRTCAAGQAPPTAALRLTAETLASEMPFSHRVGKPAIFVDRLTQSEPLRLEPKLADLRRDQIGTGGCVFLWLGAAAYESPSFIIFIDPILDEDHPSIVAAPWDTGGLRTKDSVGGQNSPLQAAALVEQYTLPAPTYRHYLGEVLHTCFADPFDYIRGNWPNPCYPGRQGRPFQYGTTTAAQTFEARHFGPLPIEGYILSIVLNINALATDDIRRDSTRLKSLRRWCIQNQVYLKESNDTSLFPDIISEAERLVRERGVL